MRSIAIPPDIEKHNLTTEMLRSHLPTIRKQVHTLYAEQPDVSVIIPAFNEEPGILKTLSSLSASSTTKKVEIIVVNNNSTDRTGQLAVEAGVTCIIEYEQGITASRNAGLQLAKGKYILNADADTIYPRAWIDKMLAPLQHDNIVMTYGSFCLIPGSGASRFTYAVYEYLSGISRWINKKFREEAVNIYGFNSAFRRTDGIAVGGFDHPAGTNEDGWLGVKLRNKFHKNLCKVTDPLALVWTSDRRIQMDGGLFRAVIKRVKRQFSI